MATWISERILRERRAQETLIKLFPGQSIKVYMWTDYQRDMELYGLSAPGGVKAGPFESVEAMLSAAKLMFGEQA